MLAHTDIHFIGHIMKKGYDNGCETVITCAGGEVDLGQHGGGRQRKSWMENLE